MAKSRNVLMKVGEVLPNGGLSLVFPKVTPTRLHEARHEFTEHMYPQLFGEEEMGDVAREFTPSEVTALSVAYEGCLKANGVIREAR